MRHYKGIVNCIMTSYLQFMNHFLTIFMVTPLTSRFSFSSSEGKSFRRNMALIFYKHLLWPNATWESSWRSKGTKNKSLMYVQPVYIVCVYSYMMRQHLAPVPDGKDRCRHSKCSMTLSQQTLCKLYLSQLSKPALVRLLQTFLKNMPEVFFFFY